MLSPCRVDQQIMEVIAGTRGTALDEIVLECPELTWNQVFLVIERPTREGTGPIHRASVANSTELRASCDCEVPEERQTLRCPLISAIEGLRPGSGS